MAEEIKTVKVKVNSSVGLTLPVVRDGKGKKFINMEFVHPQHEAVVEDNEMVEELFGEGLLIIDGQLVDGYVVEEKKNEEDEEGA